MERREFHIGPGATSLILIAVVLCMSALSMLGLVNARNDIRLSERAVAVAEKIDALQEMSERTLAKLDALIALWGEDGQSDDQFVGLGAMLPAGMTLDGDMVRWTEALESGQSLQCAVKIVSMHEAPRLAWVQHALIMNTAETESDAKWN